MLCCFLPAAEWLTDKAYRTPSCFWEVNEMTLEETVTKIGPLDEHAMQKAHEHWDSIAKPLHSLGKLEDAVTQIAGMKGDPKVLLDKKALLIFCADNGVVAEGVTQCGQDVTKAVAENFLQEKATASILCRYAGADIFPFDIGVAQDTCIPQCKIACGTKNLAKEPAMTREEAVRALEAGIRVASEKIGEGYEILATGEMGIGNTTTSSAMASVLLGLDPEIVTGRGAGLSSKGLEKKIQVIRQAIALHHPDAADPVDVLAKVGGFDIAGMAGTFLAGAAHRVPVVIDGFISAVAALLAVRIAPAAAGYILASHVSKEPAAAMLLEALKKDALLHCDMCLGEGTGAVMLFPVLDMALAVYHGMATFESTNIEAYVPLG